MTAITAPARVTVNKGRLFTRRRYFTVLWVGDIDTGLHWHLTRKEAKTFPQVIIDNAAHLMEYYGVMEQVYGRYTRFEDMRRMATLPTRGQRVRLIDGLYEGLEAGAIGTVSSVDAKPDQPYPITVAFEIDGKTEEIPLELSEVEAL
jgi:hypothetical protein